MNKASLEKLLAMTGRKLILEIADIKTGFSNIGKSERINRFKSEDKEICNLINLNPGSEIKFLDAETREFSEISESEALEKIQ